MTDETTPAVYTSPPIAAAKPGSIEEKVAKLENQVDDLTLRLAAIENGFVKRDFGRAPA